MQNLNLNLSGFEDIVLSEVGLAAVFGIDIKRMAYLRSDKGLPCVYLTKNTRIYLASEVYEWLVKLSEV